MEALLKLATSMFIDAFARAGLPTDTIKALWSNRPDLGDVQCNAAMSLAKVVRRSPRDIAMMIVEELSHQSNIAAATIEGPGFINIRFDDAAIVSCAMAQINDIAFGISTDARRILIDFGGPNIAKPLHVGHLRSLVIGESIRRILQFAGCDVISDIHLGDWGLQMGMLLSELQRRWPALFVLENVERLELPFTVDELNTIYPSVAAAARNDPIRMEAAREATARLQAGDEKYLKVWSALRMMSLEGQRKDIELLGAHFDHFLGESDSQRFLNDLRMRFEAKKLLRESDGAMIVEVAETNDNQEVPPLIFSKSDGSLLYSTTDLATILMREREYHPDEIIYVVDQRQALHFIQVFRAARMAGIATDTRLTHAGFGTVNGVDGKPYRTRDGNVAQLSELIDDAIEKARERVSSSSEDAARLVGIAALKFADLDSYRTSGYVFDPDKLVSFEGRTGPYVQYACVRMKSILAKAGDFASGTEIKISKAIERELLLACAQFPDVVESARVQLAPNEITEFAFKVAKIFSRFYNECEILTADAVTRASRLMICALVHNLLERCLWLLGIEVPEKM